MPRWISNTLRLVATLVAYFAIPPESMIVGVRYGSQILVTTNQVLDPAGTRIDFPQPPVDMALSPGGGLLAVVAGGLWLFSPSGDALRTISLPPTSITGLAFSPDGGNIAVSTLGPNGKHSVTISAASGAAPAISIPFAQNWVPTGLVFDPAGTALYVALSRANAVAKIDLVQGSIVAAVNVGVAPFGLAMTPAGDKLFVTNWGGRAAIAGDSTAKSSGTSLLVDSHGIAASGTVSVIDVTSFRVISQIPVGLHPSGIRISPDGTLAAVANSNSDSITFLDTASLQVLATVNIPAFPQGFAGSSPTALAFSGDGQRLYVACGGNNAIAVLGNQGSQFQVNGFVPTDWYPIAVAVFTADDGSDTVYAANAKGIGARNPNNFNVRQVLGTLNILGLDDLQRSWADRVASTNSPFDNALPPNDSPTDLSSLGVKHVFYIIKENRTYDQVLGDLPKGNGDASKVMYGRTVTPNHHKLASQFVLLDNYFASGVVSADGHQWLTQAMATDYIERSQFIWPRSYPYAGDDPLAFASSGFIWDNARSHGRSVRVFGEFTLAQSKYNGTWLDYLQDAQSQRMQLRGRNASPVDPLNAMVDPEYPGFQLQVPDAWRAQLFLERLRGFEQTGTLPNLVILWLPTDHTNGTAPYTPAPDSMVADNDLALGRIVEAISNSPDWPTSAIFVTEDDAQDGVDHVDGHRTIGLLAGPYVRRGVVDSTHYNQTSIIRTIEELLSLPQMNKFDAAALPMRSAFTISPDLSTYTSLRNLVPLDKMNPSLAGLTGAGLHAALDSKRMDFTKPDAAPEARLNRILWHTARGWNVPYPRVPHGPDCPQEQ